MDAKRIETALRRHHSPERGWAFFSELRVGVSWTYAQTHDNPVNRVEQEIDAWAMHTWRSQKWLRVAYEIKVSRADWKRELEQPRKREAAMALSNEFWFACPPGVIDPRDVPSGCGLLYVTEVSGECWTQVPAPHRPCSDPPLSFLAMVLRRAARIADDEEATP